MGYVATYRISGRGWESYEFSAENKKQAVARVREFLWWKTHLDGKSMRNCKWHVAKIEN